MEFANQRFLETRIGKRRTLRVGLYGAVLFCVAGHRNKERGGQRLFFEFVPLLAHQIKHLLVTLPDGDDHQPPVFELIDQRFRDVGRRAGDDDLVERSLFGPTLEPVADSAVDVFVAEVFEKFPRLLAQILDDLDGVDVLDQWAQDRRLITAPGPDLQDLVGGSRRKGFGHQ